MFYDLKILPKARYHLLYDSKYVKCPDRQVYIDRELFCSCLGLEGWENGK